VRTNEVSGQKSLYVFFRESGFYPLELRDDNDARANAESNPGTIRVLKMPMEEQVSRSRN
jgi:hypothetical protein